MGLYPLLADDTCRLLACDFDGKDGSDWQADAAAYLGACQEAGVPAALEISRSGLGAHVWTFFTAPVAATTTRALGLALLRRAIDSRGTMSLASYDRLFPAQDFAPLKATGRGRFGNLIALPLQGTCRANGTTVFCDPDTWDPHPDQFAYLSGLPRMEPAEVEALAAKLGPIQAGPTGTIQQLPARPRRKELGRAPQTVQARLAAMLEISTDGLPAPLIAALKHLASFHNPEFYLRQSLRHSTWNTPRFVCCFDATGPRRLRLPRGLVDEAARLIESAGGTLTVTRDCAELPNISATFTGELTDEQQHAVDTMAVHDTGVLMAPPGAGKTVMACALIARHETPTAIVVNRAELLVQWRDRLSTFLDLEGQAGSLGGGKDRRGHVVDLVMLQTVSHRDAADGLLDGYGLVIIDECHAVGAPSAEAALRRANVRRVVGLSATPYRADQMDPLITMQCGPIRHEMHTRDDLAKHLVVHPTDFDTDEPGTDGASVQVVYNELAADSARNKTIARDIADAHRRGRNSLALSNRVEHLQHLTAALDDHGITPLVLHGRLTPAQRAEIRAQLDAPDTGPVTLLAIDKLAGEGFDVARLDTLFVTMPVSFRGRIIQQVGRVTRTHNNKSHIEVHDYLDANVPRLERSHHKRRRTLQREGFRLTSAAALTGAPPPVRRTALPAAASIASAATQAGPEPSVAEVRGWARTRGITVTDRGRLRADIWQAWRDAQEAETDTGTSD